MAKSILIVGVGGQGTLLTGRVIGNHALAKGYDVKMSEVHGMAQRGGSVVMQVKYGEKVYSPLVEIGEADIILAFEELEALRYKHYLKENGVLITNKQQINPMPVVMGREEYPKNIESQLNAVKGNKYFIEALSIAQQLGSVKVVNMIMIGVYAALIGETLEEWESIIEQTVPKQMFAINKEAFEKGSEAYRRSLTSTY